jgi:hypothetical protein
MTLDEQIREAGSRLAGAPVAVPDFDRVVRRRHRIRAAAVAGAVATFVGVSAIWLWPNGEPSRVETGVAEAPAPSSGNDTRYEPEDAVPTYELVLGDAELVRDETPTAGNTDVALWADEARERYVSLTVRPGLADAHPEPAGLGPMEEDTEFPAAQGRAWVSETAGRDVRSMRMWWSRSDGDVWLLSAYWYGRQPIGAADGRADLRDWALGIEPGSTAASGAPYLIADPAMQLVAFDYGGDLRARARVWRYRDQEITLLAIEDSTAAGLSNLLARAMPEPVTVASQDGWMVNSASPPETIIGWQLDTPRPVWVTLTIPPELTDHTDLILAALKPA